MNKQFRISPEELDRWATEIEELPKAEPEKLNKRHAILRLLSSIKDMRENKGYSVAGVAKYFTEVKKLPITVAALKSILSHADGGASGSKKRRKRKPQEQRPSVAVSPAQAAGTEGKLPGEVSSKKGESLAEPPKTEVESRRDQLEEEG